MGSRVLFDGVSKRFHRGPAHDSLRDLIPALARRLTGREAPRGDLGSGDFWAVRDVSFEVKPGEALGIIGGNGAGKSTTLKLLTKILQPTKGVALVEGRVGSLIEVSAGFHPDLTGRENVFLQGAIMGMPRKLIVERFDDIVDFSGVGAFIDTPVKRYSSGMNARLGFAIAVNLQPDVLIIDEVLSVGDAEFQQRAFERLRQLVRGNIPVVIVSHQLDRVVELCTSCIFLKQGEVAFRGDPRDAVHAYLRGGAAARTTDAAEVPSSGIVLHSLAASSDLPIPSADPFRVRLVGDVRPQAALDRLHVDIGVIDAASNQRLWFSTLSELGAAPTGAGAFDLEIDMIANLAPGLYRIEARVWDDDRKEFTGEALGLLFQVAIGVPFGGSHQLSARVVRGG